MMAPEPITLESEQRREREYALEEELAQLKADQLLDIHAICDERDKLMEANRELLKDKERLDWLACQYEVTAYVGTTAVVLHWWHQDSCNFREALDKAALAKGEPDYKNPVNEDHGD